MTTLRRIRQLLPYLIVLVGFAVRVYAADTTWIDGDRANPHGIGIVILDSLLQGRFSELPLFSDMASVELPNPPVISYFWALVALFDRSLFTATLIGLMMNALAIAIVYKMAERVFNWETAVVSATLLAVSNWAVYLARGTWHPGHLEIGIVLTAWLLLIGVHAKSRAYLIAGFVAVALTAGTDVKAFALYPQSVLATLAAGAWKPPLRKAWATGVALCIVAFGAYLLAVIATGQGRGLAQLSLLQPERGDAAPESLAARDITAFNRDPVGHFIRLASNADYALVWTDPDQPLYELRRTLTQVQSVIIATAVIGGALILLAGWRRPANRFLLVWAAVPIAVLLAITSFKPDFRVPPYYLLVVSPVMYVCGGLFLGNVLRTLKASAIATLLTCAVLMLIPSWNFYAAAQTVYDKPFVGTTNFMPLRWSQRLGRLLRDNCRMLNGNLFWWHISLAGRSDIRRDEGVEFNDISSAWSIDPRGGTCALKQEGTPMPHAELLPLTLDDGTILRTYRSLPYPISSEPASMSVNLGWSLLEFDAPQEAAAGETIRVRHAWRVDSLPNEDYSHWYFAPFIKLIAPDDETVIDIDNAAALEGWGWRVGEVILSEVDLKLPQDLPPGTYTLQSSLFDPNQKKNAVYFRVDDSDMPILELKRQLRVTTR